MMNDLQVRCPNCNGEISRCGVPGIDGIPTWDCKACVLWDEIKLLRKALAEYAAHHNWDSTDEFYDWFVKDMDGWVIAEEALKEGR